MGTRVKRGLELGGVRGCGGCAVGVGVTGRDDGAGGVDGQGTEATGPGIVIVGIAMVLGGPAACTSCNDPALRGVSTPDGTGVPAAAAAAAAAADLSFWSIADAITAARSASPLEAPSELPWSKWAGSIVT